MVVDLQLLTFWDLLFRAIEISRKATKVFWTNLQAAVGSCRRACKIPGASFLNDAGKLKLTCKGRICECSQVKICQGSRTFHKFLLASAVVAKGTTRKSMCKKLAPDLWDEETCLKLPDSIDRHPVGYHTPCGPPHSLWAITLAVDSYFAFLDIGLRNCWIVWPNPAGHPYLCGFLLLAVRTHSMLRAYGAWASKAKAEEYWVGRGNSDASNTRVVHTWAERPFEQSTSKGRFPGFLSARKFCFCKGSRSHAKMHANPLANYSSLSFMNICEDKWVSDCSLNCVCIVLQKVWSLA